MKKRLLFLLLISLIVTVGFAQVVKPVSWSFSINKLNASEAELVLTAKVDPGWHIYSQVKSKEDGPVETSFHFKPSTSYQLIGKTSEPKAKGVYDPQFKTNLVYFSNKAIFKQKIRILNDKPFKISGVLENMACDDTRCIPPEETEFSFDIKGYKAAPKDESQVTPVNTATTPPKDTTKKAQVGKSDSINNTATQAKLAADASPFEKIKKSLWKLFFFSFLAGLAAILTPCVFPMIPMTVTFFLKDKKKSRAIIDAMFFGFSIIFIYTVIGTIVAVTLGANFANFLSTHWIPNVLFFLIFLIFSASFLGMFEITLPSWMINKSDEKVDKGGFMGPFFMAFTLVLVSFSCTGPIVGAILVQSAGGHVLEPIIGMLGFSLAFALPFTIFALFPHWLKSMPKSGGWLNAVKVVLGFLELALGLKFLSIADQTYHWHILDREVYLAFWIVIFFLMGLYLLGKLKFSHDSDLPHLRVPRLMLAIITFTFVIYMLPGMWGAPLKALSGYLPPQTSMDFDINAIVRNNSGGGGPQVSSICDKPRYGEFLHLPHGLEGYFDYTQGLACAKKQNKPVFIDFTGHGCVNCRQMEANVWSDPQVLKRMKEDFIVIALYVDDKTELPKAEQTKSKEGKDLTTIGKKYADLQISRFNVNAQPYYVLLDSDGNLLVAPRAYDLDVDGFIKFLDSGKTEFNKRKKI